MKAKTIRNILSNFKFCDNLMAASEIEHLNMVQNLLKFLIVDCESQELGDRESPVGKMTKNFTLTEVNHDILLIIYSIHPINKNKGAEQLKLKEKTETKIISEFNNIYRVKYRYNVLFIQDPPLLKNRRLSDLIFCVQKWMYICELFKFLITDNKVDNYSIVKPLMSETI